MKWRGWGSALVALVLVAGCGSTVSTTQRTAGEHQQNGDIDAPLAGGGDGPGGDAATASATGRSTAGGARGSASGRRAGSGVSAAAAALPVGPGVTADKIYVGDSYTTSNAANEAIGAAGITQGDAKKETEIVVDDINAHGGVAGHKLEIVWHPVDGNTTQPYDVIDQQSCDDWTQDHKVFAVLATPAAESETLQQCLHSRGVLLVSTDLTTSDAARFRRYPYYIEVVAMNLDRIATAEVAALKAQGWFDGWDTVNGRPGPTKAKVGIVTYDGPTWAHAVDGTLVPGLRALGYPPAPEDIVRIAPENATQDAGPIAAAASSAVLKLRGDGVTHVIVFDHAALITLFFGRAADSQNYKPRYGLNTQNGAQALINQSAMPTSQLIGSKGLGWFAPLDMPPAQNPRNGPYSNDARRRCISLLEAKGITFEDVNAESIGMNICTSYWFFRDTVKASGGALNKTAFMEGVANLGTSFLAAVNFANRYSASQHDGVAAYRYYAFDEKCGCMQYTSGNIPAP